MFPEFQDASSAVAVWVCGSLFVQVMVSPTETVMLAGEYAKPPIATAWSAAGAVPATRAATTAPPPRARMICVRSCRSAIVPLLLLPHPYRPYVVGRPSVRQGSTEA